MIGRSPNETPMNEHSRYGLRRRVTTVNAQGQRMEHLRQEQIPRQLTPINMTPLLPEHPPTSTPSVSDERAQGRPNFYPYLSAPERGRPYGNSYAPQHRGNNGFPNVQNAGQAQPPFQPPQAQLFSPEGITRLVAEVIQQMNSVQIQNQPPINRMERNENLLDVKKLPVFDNESLLHPVDFLNALESFQVQNLPYQNFAFLTSTLFEKNAKIWADAYVSTFNNYQSFRRAFLNQFWGPTKQVQIKLKIESARYTDNAVTFVDHFNYFVGLAKYLDPPYPPEMLIQMIARHFPPSIASVLVGTMDFQEALEKLRQADYYFDRKNSVSWSNNPTSSTKFNNKPVAEGAHFNVKDKASSGYRFEGNNSNYRNKTVNHIHQGEESDNESGNGAVSLHE